MPAPVSGRNRLFCSGFFRTRGLLKKDYCKKKDCCKKVVVKKGLLQKKGYCKKEAL